MKGPWFEGWGAGELCLINLHINYIWINSRSSPEKITDMRGYIGEQ